MHDLLQNAPISNDFIEPALNYINLLRNHIEKENIVLFPPGDERISMALQKRLLEKFEKFEEDIMGKGTHKKLHDLLHAFSIKYIKND
jgi:hemerythrin-like domain-containing protein